ncbi:MAG: major capsid protein [Microviridae sp.]|nr:MAG: major capsid protein [Microviridae sp.]
MVMRNRTATQHNFATVPRADIPRSKFRIRQTRKQAFDASDLIPIMCEEVLPGDTWQHTESIMARLATPIAPLVDDMDLETFYFYAPNRITWPDWEDFITGVDTALVVPKINPRDSTGANAVVTAKGVFDHFGILPQPLADNLPLTAFPIFAYFEIWNEWFRDQNLQSEWIYSTVTVANPGSNFIKYNGVTAWDQLPLRVNKRHDYFTGSLPWAQKGTAVTIGLTGNAPVKTSASQTVTSATDPMRMLLTAGGAPNNNSIIGTRDISGNLGAGAATYAGDQGGIYPTNLYADLGAVTATTINALRLAFQTQKLLERDARGGSRYVEQLLSHFGVRSPDYRLQRPEYLGGSKIPITINPIAQTAAYDAEPAASASAIGNLGAEMHASGHKRTFTYAAVEHGYIIGLAVVRATPTYQQGTRRHWRRSTRLDYYFPAFAMLGEQAVATQEIYQPNNNVPAVATWGYQEHWAELRYTPNEITGVLRSTFAQPLDWWHLSEEFGGEPALNAAFITDKTKEVLARALAIDTATSEQWSSQIIMDILHDSNVARLMPTYSVPGLIDHF